MSHRNTTAETQFLPIEEYGVIGNDNRCALVGSDGSIDWCCFPHLESPSVFAAVLDPDVGGRFAIRPDAPYDSSQAYVDRTNVLETTFETNGGTVTVTDFMPVRNDDAPDEPFQQSIYRKITGVEGTVDVDVRFEPRFDYARAETTLAADDGDVVATVSDGADVAQRPLYVHADLDFAIDAERAAATTTVPVDAGDVHWLTVWYAQ
jgi:alpha,alpha-trehalase